ncbi:acetyltransferase [Chryseobacterium sp. POE27]|uniref:acetyltransferase n=1 Tax=Chryseobacterium sp. POE27 TaxID=3138177 RepID=UPI0032199559
MIKFDNKILIVGASGFGKEVLMCLTDCIAGTGLKIEEIACFLETEEFYEKTKTVHGISVITDDQFDPADYHVVVAIGDPKIRKKAVEKLPKETKYTTIVHPSAIISEYVEIGEGSIITAGTIVTTDITIGKHAHLNLHTTIGHDCKIGDYFTTAPATNISGLCEIGDNVYFGTNSSIRQGIKVCDNVTIGMGGIVVKDIREEGVYIGSPVKKL